MASEDAALMGRIDAYWSGRAKEFSRTRMEEFAGDLKPQYWALISPWIPAGARRVLDVGTGAGFFALLFAEHGLEVTGVDYSDAMLAEAKENARRLGLSAAFQQGDAQALDFSPESFDFLFSRNVTWTLPAPERMYAGVARLLKAGGVFVNLDANYGRTFKEADAAGLAPAHPTQSAAQLRERNDIAESLSVTERDRPRWDAEVLEAAGLEIIGLDEAAGEKLRGPEQAATVTAAAGRISRLFLIAARKPR